MLILPFEISVHFATERNEKLLEIRHDASDNFNIGELISLFYIFFLKHGIRFVINYSFIRWFDRLLLKSVTFIYGYNYFRKKIYDVRWLIKNFKYRLFK